MFLWCLLSCRCRKAFEATIWPSNQGTLNPKTHFYLFILTDPIKAAKKSNSWSCFTACLVSAVRAKLISEHLIFLFLIYLSLFSRHVWAGNDSFHLMQRTKCKYDLLQMNDFSFNLVSGLEIWLTSCFLLKWRIRREMCQNLGSKL